MPKILVIDDDPDLLATVREMLTGLGHRVVEASNGRVGLQALEGDQFDLVICDIFMPEREGLETIMQLQETHPALPILAITGRDELYLGAAQRLGAAAVLRKPFGIEELRSSIDQLLDAGSTG